MNQRFDSLEVERIDSVKWVDTGISGSRCSLLHLRLSYIRKSDKSPVNKWSSKTKSPEVISCCSAFRFIIIIIFFLIFLYPTISSSYNSKLLRIRTDELQRDKMKVSTSPGFFSKLTVCAAVLSVVRKRKWTLSPVFNTACLCFSCLDKLFFHYLKRMAYKAFPGAQDKDDTHKSSCFFVAAWNT